MDQTLRIEFDRADRTYRSGEPVRGVLLIDAEQGAESGIVHLLHYWRTSGGGKPDSGGRGAKRIHEGPLEGDPPFRIPFHFVAPGGPFTYHGTLLNVDHYVEARVDVSGLFDTGPPEAFVLVPGTRVDPPAPRLMKVSGIRSSMRGCGSLAGLVLVLVGVFSLPMGLILLIPGLFLLVPGLNRWLAGTKIGKISSGLEDAVVEPGTAARVHVRLTPRKECRIREATAVLRAREVVTSVQGDSKRVRVQEIHRSREYALSGPRELTAGQPVTLEAEMELPGDPAYTFASDHNEVTWDVLVYVDIPAWPDWRQEHRLIVWPFRPGLEAGEPESGRALPSEEPPLPSDEPRTFFPSEETRPSLPSEEPGPSLPSEEPRPSFPPEQPGPSLPLPEPERPPAAAPAGPREVTPIPASTRDESEAAPAGPREAPSSLGSAVQAILERKAFGGGRESLIRQLVGRSFTFEMAVDLVEHTFGAGPDPGYRHGRTVTGKVAGSEISIEVRFPAERNDEIDGYRRGELHTLTATVVDWEKLSEQPVLQA